MTAMAQEAIGTKEAVKTALALLGAAFNRAVDGTVATAYWIALRDLSPADISLATERALARSKFMPAPAELRDFAGRGKRRTEERAALAWESVRAAISRHDWVVASIDFGPLVNAVIRNLGGWDTMHRATLADLDNPGWLRKRFVEVFALFADHDATVLHGEPLVCMEARGMSTGAQAVRVAIKGELPPRSKRSLPPIADSASAARLISELAEAKSR